MKLAKYMLPAGQPGVGRIDADDLLPLDLTKGQYRSLFEILESDNPHETAEFLTLVGLKKRSQRADGR